MFRLKKNVANTYEKSAQVQRYIRGKLIKKIPGPSTVKSILDLGCATGEGAVALQNHMPHAKVLGVDISPDLIQKAKSLTHAKKIVFTVADMDQLILPQSVDIIFSNATLQWANSLENVLNQCQKWLTPHGRLVATVFGPKTFVELGTSLRKVINADSRLPAATFLEGPNLLSRFNAVFRQVSMHQENIQRHYSSLRSLLQNIRNTGTQGKAAATPSLWTPSLLAKVENAYLQRHRSILTSYQVFYIVASND